MISIEERMTIIILHQQGYSQRAIARKLGISRNTVKKHLHSDEEQPHYAARSVQAQKLDPYKDFLKKRIALAAPIHFPAALV